MHRHYNVDDSGSPDEVPAAGGLVGEAKLMRRSLSRLGYFTLIELLITIAIIAILASMLLPALSAARDKGKSIKCVGNAKQISLMVSMYAGDKDGYAPYKRVGTIIPHWGGKLWRENYCSSTGVFVCPNATHYKYAMNCVTSPESYFGWDYTTYGINRYFIDNIYGATHKLITARRPSQKILLGDAIIINTNYGTATLDRPDGLQPGYGFDNRHGKGANVAYADGHVSFEKMAWQNLEMTGVHRDKYWDPAK